MEFNRINRHEAGTIVTHMDLRSKNDYGKNKMRPYLIISNDEAAIEGDSDYIVLPFTSTTIKKGKKKGEQKHKKWFHIELDFKKCGLLEDCFIRGNRPDVITHGGVKRVVGKVDSKTLTKARKVLSELVKDKSLSKYKESFQYWIDAYNTAHDTKFTLETATEQMKDEFHISLGRQIDKSQQKMQIIFRSDFAYITANLDKE